MCAAKTGQKECQHISTDDAGWTPPLTLLSLQMQPCSLLLGLALNLPPPLSQHARLSPACPSLVRPPSAPAPQVTAPLAGKCSLHWLLAHTRPRLLPPVSPTESVFPEVLSDTLAPGCRGQPAPSPLLWCWVLSVTPLRRLSCFDRDRDLESHRTDGGGGLPRSAWWGWWPGLSPDERQHLGDRQEGGQPRRPRS